METLRHTIYRKTDGYGYIFLNRPELHNAMDAIMIEELKTLINEIPLDESIRAIVIRGMGRSFSSGADLNYMQSLINATKRENLEDAGKLSALFDSIYNCPLPVISVAHGNVSGGANGIIAASDIALCAENTVFRFSELKLGLVPATISPYIVQRIGQAKAAELMFTSRSFSGSQAFSFGLVNKSVKETELDASLLLLLKEMHSSGPIALRKAKLLIRAVAGKEIDSEMRRFTTRVIAEVRISPEAQEGMKAFLEKRKPQWSK
jgi:methylglutaconyl-CoA hydratase